MIRSKHGEMTFSAKQVAILLISAVAIAGVTFAVGYLSKGKQTTEKAPTAAKPNADTPAAPGAITQKLDTDAILKEREIEKSAAPGAQFTFQKTLMKDAAPAKESPPAVKPAPQEPTAVKPAPAEPAKTENKGPQATAPKEKPRHDTQPATAKSTATPGKVFTIQVASFSAKADADKLVARLESRRFIANIQEFKDKADIWYRVRVGAYKTEQAANRDLAKVKAEGAPRAFVTSY
jgi:cell division septation protein DedD